MKSKQGLSLVYVVTFWPYPTNAGGKLRVANMIKGLSREFDVHLVALCTEDEVGSEQRVDLESKGLTSARTVLDRGTRIHGVMGMLRGLPYEVARLRNRKMEDIVESVAEELSPDILLCSRLAGSQFVSSEMKMTKVIDQHDLSRRLWKLMSKNARSPLVRLIAMVNRKMVERYELQAYKKFNACISVSKDEERITKRFAHEELSTIAIPNGSDIGFYQPRGFVQKSNSIILFGAMNQVRNVDAAVYLVREIMPLVWARIPNVQVWIVGRDPASQVSSLADELVNVTGTVDDDRPYIEKASLVVAPYKNGSGVKHKIPIALSLCKATISTSTGCHGLDVTDGKDIIIRNDTVEFSSAIVELLGDEEECKRLGRNGRKLIEKSYSWDSLAHEASDFLKILLVAN